MQVLAVEKSPKRAAVPATVDRESDRIEPARITAQIESRPHRSPLVDVAPRLLLRQPHDELGTRLADLGKLSDANGAALLHILDGLLANIRIRAALDNAGRVSVSVAPPGNIGIQFGRGASEDDVVHLQKAARINEEDSPIERRSERRRQRLH